ncbi:MAG TPA: FAD-dependent oxidoreductase [Pirellulales bacterium]
MPHPLIASIITAWILAAAPAETAQQPADPALEPPPINLQPGPQYADDTRPFQGIPGLERAANGRLWATWYAGGPGEGGANYVLLTTSADDGRTWSGPKLVIDPPGPVRAYDPCLWRDPQGRLWLFWAQSHNWWDGRSGVWAIVTDNPGDASPRWSQPRRLSDGIMMNKPTVLTTGEWLMPAAIWQRKFNTDAAHGHDLSARSGAGVMISRDRGATWGFRGRATVPSRVFDEHSIIERRDGSLWMLVRAAYGIGESVSTDRGQTWSPGLQAAIQHVNSRFFICRLHSGKLLLVTHNPPNHKTRSHLVAHLSDDDGQTWHGGLMIDDRAGVSYPDGVQAPDGTIYLIYDFERTGQKQILLATFTEQDVSTGQWQSKQARQRVLVNQATGQKQQHTAAVIVYGATPAGICAAIGAAREGVSVALVESSQRIGGVNTGGLCFSDSNQMLREALRGLFEEFHQRIEDDYKSRGIKLNYSVATKDHKSWTYEPHVAERVAWAMLKEAKVNLFTGQMLESVDKEGPKLKAIRTTEGSSFSGKTFIDATYEGDLLAAAKVSWVIGREGRDEFGESLAGKQYPKPPMAISGLSAAGQLLPLLTGTELGSDEAGDRNVMTYSFRLCLTANPANRVPFPQPAHYESARFEVVRRYFAKTPKAPLLWDLYPLPGEKVDANNGIGKQFSMGLVGGGNDWCEASPQERKRIWEAHKQYTLELYRFLTTDAAVPQALRDKLAQYGLCKDEFAEYDHWSPQLYVREGRRMRGEYLMKQADILTDGSKPDSIAVVSFPIDSHDCRRIARGADTVVNEGTIFPVRVSGIKRGSVYQVPFRCLTPPREQCTNLLVPVALSATHVAYCSLRVEPAWMVLGQSAGIAAALAAKQKQAMHELVYSQLKARLLAQGQVVDVPSSP